MTGFKASLPDCRAYEMVSPPYKESFEVGVQNGISADGSQVLGESFGAFLNPGGQIPEGNGNLGHYYRFRRGETSWESIPLEAPFSRFVNLNVLTASPDFGSSIWIASVPGEAAEDVYLDRSGGMVTFVGPGAPPGVRETAAHVQGESEDLRHVLFSAHSANGGEQSPIWPGDTTLPGGLPSLYEYVGTGNAEPHLVGITDEGTPAHIAESHLISDCGTFLGGERPETEGYNAVSASGDTVFFTAMPCAGGPPTEELDARIDGEKTLAISEPPLSVPGRTCTGTCAVAENVPANRRPGIFAGASLDGTRVFFSTSQPLVDADTDNGTDLYAADLHEGKLTRLVQVSRGGEGDPTPGAGADVLGVARVSEDGSHVYFVAQGVLTGMNVEGKAPVGGEANLYVTAVECPAGEATCPSPTEHTSFIATLSGADGEDWSPADHRPVQATPDGRFFVFQSTADLTPDQEGRPEAGQVFEYDAQNEVLVRVSHGQDGYGENGNSNTFRATIHRQEFRTAGAAARFMGLSVSRDGSRVFFTTAAALTPHALEGFSSVYESHDGEVSLIAAGDDSAAETATNLVGTDESGQDVFFNTTDQLLPQDRDTSTDVYDARTDGGFPPPAPMAPCAGDSCQGAAPMQPALSTPGTATSLPLGQPTPPAPVVTPRLTAAQELAKALKACRAKHNRRQRTRCERAARKKHPVRPVNSSEVR